MFSTLWYSRKLRVWVAQIALMGSLAALIWWIGGNTAQNLTERGIRTGLDFLSRPARFPISETVLHYSPEDSFLWAFIVGLANTLWLSALTILLATVLGLALALARLSAHPLLSRLAAGYVTLFRNIPLIVQLLFFYGVATSVFPPPLEAWTPLPGIYLTLRGAYAPDLFLSSGGSWLLATIALALILMLRITWRWPTGKALLPPPARLCAAVVLWLSASITIWHLAGRPIRLEFPELNGLNFRGGQHLSPEFCAIILGLTLYTAAFVGEVIRGGIQAVSKGQWEGGHSLGLSERQIMFRIILPQALRIIIPPMTSQYLSTVKNTTLAVAVGYPELGLVVNTVINQTGQALESILIMLGVFLTISLSVSVLMNWLNARVALVER